jgi:hypothetical protein
VDAHAQHIHSRHVFFDIYVQDAVLEVFIVRRINESAWEGADLPALARYVYSRYLVKPDRRVIPRCCWSRISEYKHLASSHLMRALTV